MKGQYSSTPLTAISIPEFVHVLETLVDDGGRDQESFCLIAPLTLRGTTRGKSAVKMKTWVNAVSPNSSRKNAKQVGPLNS